MRAKRIVNCKQVGTDEVCDRTCDFCERAERDDLPLHWDKSFLSCDDCERLGEVERLTNTECFVCGETSGTFSCIRGYAGGLVDVCGQCKREAGL